MHRLDKQKHGWHSKKAYLPRGDKNKMKSKNVLRFRLDSVKFQVFLSRIWKYVQCILYSYTNSTKKTKKHPAYLTHKKAKLESCTRKIFYQKTKMPRIFSSNLDGIRRLSLECNNTQNACIRVNKLLYFICNYISIACRCIVYICYLFIGKQQYRNEKNVDKKYPAINRTEK